MVGEGLKISSERESEGEAAGTGTRSRRTAAVAVVAVAAAAAAARSLGGGRWCATGYAVVVAIPDLLVILVSHASTDAAVGCR